MPPPPRAARGPGAAHDQQRRLILEAVFTIVDERGTEHVSVRNVAGEAGISPGRVQHYFPTKDALLEAAFTEINERGARSVRRRLGATDPGDLEAIATAVLIELVPADDEHRRLVRIGQAFEVYASTRLELRRRLTADYDGLIELIAGLLPSGGDRGAAARDLVALANGLGSLVVTGNDAPERARRAIADQVRRSFEA
ncbi:TetR/AcrR family transcriptional regulator [Glycomyces terrestris]|uniref:TetR family transcriptional regulator n=1 Tax=Glycomyces terrestris TaxID=2493553 RepID=A0A426V335_9ACTN|nr:TetR/AcrR family transcriptional regulator [Glycomyces terrestris]RRS01238.1 TetR family transcriptional regulator [Glycomyces terrestris]